MFLYLLLLLLSANTLATYFSHYTIVFCGKICKMGLYTELFYAIIPACCLFSLLFAVLLSLATSPYKSFYTCIQLWQHYSMQCQMQLQLRDKTMRSTRSNHAELRHAAGSLKISLGKSPARESPHQRDWPLQSI